MPTHYEHVLSHADVYIDMPTASCSDVRTRVGKAADWLFARALGLRSDEPRDDYEYPAGGRPARHGSGHGDASVYADGDADDAGQLPAQLHARQHGAGAGSERTANAGAGPGGRWSWHVIPGPGPGGDAFSMIGCIATSSMVT